MKDVLTIRDLHDLDLGRIRGLVSATEPPRHLPQLVVALMFDQPSLRTRLGFATASLRLGGGWVEIGGDHSRLGMSEPERLSDVVRVASGMVDALVYRGQLPSAEISEMSVAPVLNGGDDRQHPTQALIDWVTIERCVGPLDELTVAICGDLGSRCATSLLELFGRIPPRCVRLIAPIGRDVTTISIPDSLSARVERADELDPGDVDVVYLPGLAEGVGERRISAAVRRRFQVTAETMRRMPSHAAVLSPMPVIDEISDDARHDRRVRLFEATDLSVRVRMEALAIAIDGTFS